MESQHFHCTSRTGNRKKLSRTRGEWARGGKEWKSRMTGQWALKGHYGINQDRAMYGQTCLQPLPGLVKNGDGARITTKKKHRIKRKGGGGSSLNSDTKEKADFVERGYLSDLIQRWKKITARSGHTQGEEEQK